ncbi:MAG TPA: aminotransferase class V-fold PLP-dependent enzyme [Candidatus Dormibacteraeota bacterium]|jgi:cysteine desulfurase|nr:aminotransferase class V-fold PLP-dependent enzyme [Candidatus Dormibacteraeota bacterium]
MRRIFLDDAGGAPLLPEVIAALRDLPNGNPSSPHAEGRAARAALDRARDLAAKAIGADRTEITFTSSGTEAVNLALFGAARRMKVPGAIVTWAAEHQAVLGAVRRLQSEGHRVEIAPVDSTAHADSDAIKPGTALVSIGLANNEVGTLQPVQEVIDRAHEVGAIVHVDACAGPRWVPVPGGADLVSFSGHKLGSGRGGALYVKDGVRVDPLLYGGPQEWGRRAGHEDVAAAVAIANAIAVSVRDQAERADIARKQSNALRDLLGECGAQLTGADGRLPNFASCAFDDRKGEDMLLALDMAGLAASSGSACASGSLDPSHVLLAMGLSMNAALGSLRLTTGYATTDEDISRARDILSVVLTRSAARA